MIKNILASKSLPGALLCAMSLLALLLANSPLDNYYGLFKSFPIMLKAGDFVIDKPLLLWINDGLMAIFFLLIGLEIKRELLEGHLSSMHLAILPAVAAVGGVIFPALIYAYINRDNPSAMAGWAIPAATDIAFALGVITALGKRVPVSLKVCLAAIAVIDDLAAVVIIALFYTAEISTTSLVLALIGLSVAALMNRKNVTNLSPYVVVGLFVWACVLKSGVHATLAGVALGLLIPLKAKNRNGASPLKVTEHALNPWVSLLIIPLFAFANAGVSFKGLGLETFTNPITLGIILGLFFGKQAGVMLFTYVFCALKICKLPKGVTWVHYYGMSLLTGIGFTMSLFIGTLAFPDIENIVAVRIGVISGSLLSVLAGTIILVAGAKRTKRTKPVRVRAIRQPSY